MKQIIGGFISVVLVFTMLVACGTKALPEGLSEETLTATANTALTAFNEKEFNTLTTMFRSDLQTSLTDDSWQLAYNQIEAQLGTFEKVTSTAVSGQQGNDGANYGIVILSCKYAKASVNCVVTFDSDGQLVGFVFQ